MKIMMFPMMGSLYRCTLKTVVPRYVQCKQNVNKRASALGSVRFMTTDNSDKSETHSEKRIPRAGNYRSPWLVLKEEFQGIKTMTPPGTYVPRETDFLIIGGGIVGSSVAYWLKQYNTKAISVTVIERDPSYTKASSMLSWEGVRHQFSIPENVQLSMCASEFLSDIREHLSVKHEGPPDVQFNHQGYLILAHEKDAEQLAENVDMQKNLGARVVLLSKQQLTEKYPWMNFDGIECGSLGLEGEGWLDPWSLLRAFKQKNLSMGVKYIQGDVTNFEFENINSTNDIKFRVISAVIKSKDDQECETKFSGVINCAGPWAADIAEMAGIGKGDGDLAIPLPIEPRKRSVYVTHCPSGPSLDCPFVIDPSGLFFRREGFGGHYVCGHVPTSETDEPPIANFDTDFNLYEERVLPALTSRVPCFNTSNLKAAWAGYNDYNIFDQNLVVGPHPYLTNFFFANGLGGHGLQHAIGVGRALMEYILEADYVTIDMEKFHFSRFLTKTRLNEQMTLHQSR
uniref:FAD-dependent oxidoreductase domain-containing protein 1 n=1 Tax=Arion vulgaris TaxID=1028688 RepID=A0A0B7B017_9EUPU